MAKNHAYSTINVYFFSLDNWICPVFGLLKLFENQTCFRPHCGHSLYLNCNLFHCRPWWSRPAPLAPTPSWWPSGPSTRTKSSARLPSLPRTKSTTFTRCARNRISRRVARKKRTEHHSRSNLVPAPDLFNSLKIRKMISFLLTNAWSSRFSLSLFLTYLMYRLLCFRLFYFSTLSTNLTLFHC